LKRSSHQEGGDVARMRCIRVQQVPDCIWQAFGMKPLVVKDLEKGVTGVARRDTINELMYDTRRRIGSLLDMIKHAHSYPHFCCTQSRTFLVYVQPGYHPELHKCNL